MKHGSNHTMQVAAMVLEKGIAMENPRNRGEIRVKQQAAKDRPGEVGDMWRFYWEACGGRR